jgi:hypothetical protein
MEKYTVTLSVIIVYFYLKSIYKIKAVVNGEFHVKKALKDRGMKLDKQICL